MSSISNNGCSVEGCANKLQLMADGSRKLLAGMCGAHYRKNLRDNPIKREYTKERKYELRYSYEGRAYCIGDDNKCMNLAGIKGRKGDKILFHSRCDRHRRAGRVRSAFLNQNSTHYLPLNGCAWCDKRAEHRHRIEPSKGYYTDNVLTLCKECHYEAHYGVKSTPGNAL